MRVTFLGEATPRLPIQVRLAIWIELHAALRALEDLRLGDRFAGLVEPLRLVGLEAEVEQLLALGHAQRLGARARHHRHQPALAAARGRNEAVARGLGESRLHAVHRGIDPEETVAVGLAHAVVDEFLLRVSRIEQLVDVEGLLPKRLDRPRVPDPQREKLDEE